MMWDTCIAYRCKGMGRVNGALGVGKDKFLGLHMNASWGQALAFVSEGTRSWYAGLSWT